MLGPSPIDGQGLFAATSIDTDDVLEIMDGGLLGDDEARAMIARGERYDGVALDVDVNLRIEPRDWPGIFGNHACDGNLWMRDAVTVVARRPIAAGEELTLDYSLVTIMADWRMPCRCCGPLCRGVVSGDDWRPPELQARYGGHFTPAIKRLISDLARPGARGWSRPRT